jgi:triosephosphate isomerase
MKNSKKHLIGNWKMHKSLTQTRYELSEINSGLQKLSLSNPSYENWEFGVAAVGLFLGSLTHQRHLSLYAQNAHSQAQGAYTGEWSAAMLSEFGWIKGSLVAHSERRQYFGCDDAHAGASVVALLKERKRAVLCIGETWESRRTNQWKEVISSQLNACSQNWTGLSHSELLGDNPHYSPLLLAYEPVWAIGTGVAATPQQAEETHAFIFHWFQTHWGNEFASRIPVLYGGSVHAKNIQEFLACPHVSGALVGGASLQAKDFLELARLALQSKTKA